MLAQIWAVSDVGSGLGATPLPSQAEKKAGAVGQPTFLRRLFDRVLGRSASAAGASASSGSESTMSVYPVGNSRFAQLRVGLVSTVGNYREHNEDNFYIPANGTTPTIGGVGQNAVAEEFPARHERPLLFIVADGMGGQQAGEKASAMAVEIIPKELAKRIEATEGDREVRRAIQDAVAAANQEILGLSHVQPDLSNMGTTVVLTLFRDSRAYVAGIGDSRVYRIRNGEIECLTKDHSLARALFEAGTISKEELPNHKFTHVLYLYLGSKDALGGPEHVDASDVHPGDRFLLASDGLTGVVEDEQLAAIVTEEDDPLKTASRLVDLALDNQSKDNVTCMIIHAV